jgi:putative ABC transport system ATP-binding protein
MIEIKNLSKNFDAESHLVFKDYTFEDGKTYVITGPSGCGKSTLLNLVSGIISPTTGKIFVNACNQTHKLHRMTQKEKDAFRFANIGYIFQDFKLVEDFTVLDNMKMLNINGKIYSDDDIDRALEIAHITKKKNQKVRSLSGGEKQRVSIARAIIKKSNIVLADEPTESLNEALSHEIIELLTQIAKTENKTLIMVTHDNSLTKYFDVHLDVKDFMGEVDDNA